MTDLESFVELYKSLYIHYRILIRSELPQVMKGADIPEGLINMEWEYIIYFLGANSPIGLYSFGKTGSGVQLGGFGSQLGIVRFDKDQKYLGEDSWE